MQLYKNFSILYVPYYNKNCSPSKACNCSSTYLFLQSSGALNFCVISTLNWLLLLLLLLVSQYGSSSGSLFSFFLLLWLLRNRRQIIFYKSTFNFWIGKAEYVSGIVYLSSSYTKIKILFLRHEYLAIEWSLFCVSMYVCIVWCVLIVVKFQVYCFSEKAIY